MQCAVINAQSVRNKPLVVADFVADNDLDFLAITETWLKQDGDLDVIGALTPDGYSFILILRSYGAGGGVEVLFKKTLKLVKTSFLPSFRTFEQLECTISLDNSCLHLVVVYRPPPSRVNGFTVKDILEEFTDAAHRLSLRNGQLLLLGDVNLHLEDLACRDSATFGNILDDCSLALHSCKPSYFSGHCLDVIITRKADNLIQYIATNNPGISDHFAINFNILDHKPQPLKKSFSFTKLRSVNRTNLGEDLSQVNQIDFHHYLLLIRMTSLSP